MFVLSNNNIVTISRGDTGISSVYINIGTEYAPKRYILHEDDKLYLGVMEPNQSFENAIIKKIYTKDNLDDDGDVIVIFTAEDTENLEPGLYYYQIKLVRNNIEARNIVDTIRPNTKFYIVD